MLLDLLGLRPWWSRHDSQWVAVPAVDTEAALAGCRVDWVPERVAGRPLGAVAGIWEAWRLLGRAEPDVVVSAGTVDDEEGPTATVTLGSSTNSSLGVGRPAMATPATAPTAMTARANGQDLRMGQSNYRRTEVTGGRTGPVSDE